jgi:uncharacterized repeat protein (TIGR01451 family)
MKISQRTTPARSTAALAVGLIAIPATMAASHPVARSPQTPGLAISVSDGHVAARAGDRLTYTVRVRDNGTRAVPRLKITQTLSAGLAFISASEHGVAADGRVSWSAGLPAGGTRTFQVDTRVTKTPARVLRLAAVACVALPGSSRPVVCAAHLDRLPAAAASVPRSGRAGPGLLAYAWAGLGVLALGLLAAIVTRRRGRPRRQPA